MKQRRQDHQTVSFDPQAAGETGDDASTEGRDLVTQLAASTPDPAQSMDMKEQFEIVQESLDKLPESQKVVLILHDMQDLSYQEIAEIVGTSIGTVRSRLHYGRLKLRELLSPYFSAETPLNFPLTAR